MEALERLRHPETAFVPTDGGPILTGDPEWDAMELAEHDPSNLVG